MRRRLWLGAFGVALALASLPVGAEAQGRTCRQVLPSDFRRIVNLRGQEILYFLDPVRVLCTGGIRLEADSAIMNRAAGTVELVGAVVYQDSTRKLRSDWANYLGKSEQLLARGSPVLEDLEGGSVLAGDELVYLRETETRPRARMTVTGERTYAVIPPETDGTVADTGAVSTEVWADRMVIEGEELFEAFGAVALQRGDVTGSGDQVRFDQLRNHMTLTGTAHIQNPDYRLEGDRIDASIEGETLREVLSEENARVLSEDLNVRSDRVRIGFVDGEIERLEAWNPDPATAPRRARARARGFRLRADSIDVQADSLGIRELRAVGRAYGERALAGEALATATPVPGAIARDWIQGDTILGFFRRPGDRAVAAGDSVAPESGDEEARAASRGRVVGEMELADEAASEGEAAEPEVVLERIVVIGGGAPALSLYRMASDDASEKPSINFMKAKRIILFMEQGDVSRVEAEGPIEGLYLTPGGAPREGARQGGSERGREGAR